MDKRYIFGYILVIVGFIMILINAINYIFHLGKASPSRLVLAIIFLTVGMMNVRAISKMNISKTKK